TPGSRISAPVLIRKATRARAWQPGESGRLSQREEADLRNFTTHCLSLVNTRQELETKGRIEQRIQSIYSGWTSCTRCATASMSASTTSGHQGSGAAQRWRRPRGLGDEHQSQDFRPRGAAAAAPEASQPPLQLPSGSNKRSPTVSVNEDVQLEKPKPSKDLGLPPNRPRRPATDARSCRRSRRRRRRRLRLNRCSAGASGRASGGGSGAEAPATRREEERRRLERRMRRRSRSRHRPSDDEEERGAVGGGGFAYQTLNDFNDFGAAEAGTEEERLWTGRSAACATWRRPPRQPRQHREAAAPDCPREATMSNHVDNCERGLHRAASIPKLQLPAAAAAAVAACCLFVLTLTSQQHSTKSVAVREFLTVVKEACREQVNAVAGDLNSRWYSQSRRTSDESLSRAVAYIRTPHEIDQLLKVQCRISCSFSKGQWATNPGLSRSAWTATAAAAPRTPARNSASSTPAGWSKDSPAHAAGPPEMAAMSVAVSAGGRQRKLLTLVASCIADQWRTRPSQISTREGSRKFIPRPTHNRNTRARALGADAADEARPACTGRPVQRQLLGSAEIEVRRGRAEAGSTRSK
uniref:Reverse transcriptase domain-containing protein n=1 Tax=Macrostomum lignano TaxID=282301 RepID=A0A1I8FJW1_9PLAT